MILSEQLAEGEKLPEQQLCDLLGVSRTPLREALKVLASEGLLELLPNRGARVTRLTLDDLDQMVEVMAALEGLAGELACERLTDDTVDAIRELHDEMIDCYDRNDMLQLFKVDQILHLSIVRATDNDILTNMYEGLAARMRRVRFKGARRDESQQGLMDDHIAMMAALSERDGRRLGRIMRDHIRKKGRIVREIMVEERTSP